MSDENNKHGPHTRLVHTASADPAYNKLVNPPIERASTMLFDKAEDLYAFTPGARYYGRQGTASQYALRKAIADMEGAAAVTLAPSGLAACTLPLLALSRPGGHMLISDSVYGPTRAFCDGVLRDQHGLGIEYFDPRIGADLAAHIRPETCVIFLESPGSLTFEINDLKEISKLAQARQIPTLIDNTWSAGWFLKPLALGIDYSLQAATKYHTGHSDVIMGSIAARTKEGGRVIADYARLTGNMVSPDDAWLVLRGMRTMGVRLERQAQSALDIARWLSAREDVAQVLHPALPEHPDHAIWKRDFNGASGLFGFILNDVPEESVLRFLDSLKLFGLGFSWGGYESLAIHCDPQIKRTARPWQAAGPLIRLSIGLEDKDDLIADLTAGLNTLTTP